MKKLAEFKDEIFDLIASGNIMFVLDTNFHIKAVNNLTCSLLSCKKGDILKQHYSNFISNRHTVSLIDHVESKLKKEKTWSGNICLFSEKTKQSFWMHAVMLKKNHEILVIGFLLPKQKKTIRLNDTLLNKLSEYSKKYLCEVD